MKCLIKVLLLTYIYIHLMSSREPSEKNNIRWIMP